MTFDDYSIQRDDDKWSNRNAKAELKYCGHYMVDRKRIKNLDLHFYAWLFRAALREIEKETNKEKDLLSLCEALSDCLERAAEQLTDFGERIADDPLTADCCACIKQFQCGEEPDTPCEFKWTFANEAEWLINKTKGLKHE